MDRGRWRTAYVRLMCGTAVLAIGLSGWTLWEVWDRRHTVDEACAGLVPAGEVLALSGSGGEITAAEEIEPDKPFAQACVLRSAEAAEALGGSGTRQFFIARLATEPTGWTSEPVDDSFQDPLDPSNPWIRVPLVHQPVGGGITGEVTENGVAVRLPCPGVEHQGEEITAIRAAATLDLVAYREFGQDGQLRQADRDRLADIAVAAADNLAAELGCPDRLPEPPDGIPALNTEPVDPDEAAGTCAWYGAAGLHTGPANSSGWLPDQVLESRAGELVWQERCLLTVSGEARGATHLRHRDDPAYRRYREADEGRGLWWLSAESFFGDAAEQVATDPVHEERTVEHGTGGYDRQGNAWWATSVCDGEPAVHVLTAGYPYVHGAGRHLEPVLRAYVEDVAERRGCTDAVLPTADDFARAD
ncbi:hypothetical protein CUT44_15270 [Streptomyces carminius]|uniref:Uncharacterized protein n=1 Tax=Streptomyces carminius TaxID=2665496 RepID=A0A2M8LYB7_9ACTN|nr:hypothetical protein [Streptomyces carminius]PJE96914.1 hypothetical protein CUT44_15270 [Streptomyces carminius]